MPAERMSGALALVGDPAGDVDARAPVAAVAALGMERACLEAAGAGTRASGVLVYQSGPGAERAAAAARSALAAGAGGLVSWGFAAGLAPEIEPAMVVVPSRVLVPAGRAIAADRPWRAALLRALGQRFSASEGELLSVDDVLRTPSAKNGAAVAHAAVVADMESAAIAAVAQAAGVPFVALRVVLDGLGDVLPPGIERWIDAAGNRCYAPVLPTLGRPATWGALLVLARRYARARATLTRVARRLVPAELALPRRTLHVR